MRTSFGLRRRSRVMRRAKAWNVQHIYINLALIHYCSIYIGIYLTKVKASSYSLEPKCFFALTFLLSSLAQSPAKNIK